MIPSKLQSGSSIRIVSPSFSMGRYKEIVIARGIETLQNMGFTVSVSENSFEVDEFESSSVSSRVQDLEAAFLDPDVDGILCMSGGFNVNQLLDEIDWDIIMRNPKVLLGYSDITVLANALYARTGIMSYLGPILYSFAEQEGMSYTEEYFRKCVMETKAYAIAPCEKWRNESDWEAQTVPPFQKNDGFWIMQKGEASGTLLGGNLCSFNLLQGTQYMPELEGVILFLEEDNYCPGYMCQEFDRNLVSLIQQKGFGGVKGIVIGKFEWGSGVTRAKLERIIASKKQLQGLPIIANADFGHTTPMLTLPVGGKVAIQAGVRGASIEVQEF